MVEPSPNTTARTDQAQDLGDVIVEQESTKRHQAQVAAQMNTLLHTLDRMITLLRVYPHGHPLIETFAEQTVNQLNELAEQEEYIYIRLKPTELLTEWNTPFFTREESERENFLWYQAAADGLVSIEIRPGLTSRELIDFMSVINRAELGKLPIDDDTITILWDLDIENIDYHAIEGYIDTGEAGVFGNLSEPEAKVMVMSAAINPVGEQGKKLTTIFEGMPSTKVDVFTKIQYKAEPLKAMPDIPADALAEAFRVDTSWSKTLLDEWTSGDNLEYRLIESLLSVVRTNPDAKQSENAVDTIVQITNQLLESADYKTVSLILKLLRARRANFEGTEINPLARMLEYISDPMRLEALIFQAQKVPGDRPAIIDLLKLLDEERVQNQILITLSSPSKEIRAVSALVDILLAVTTRQTELKLIDEKYISKDVYFVRTLQGLRGRDISEYPILPRLLTLAMKQESREVRLQALGLAEPSWCTAMVLDQYVAPLLSDDDQEIRRLAIQIMRDYRPDIFKEWLESHMKIEELVYRSAGEMRFLLKLWVEEDSSNLRALRDMLDTRGWFNNKRRLLAKNAALVLLEFNDTTTIESLKQSASSLWTAPSLRKEYRSILEQFDIQLEPPPETPAQESDPSEEAPEA